MDRKRSTALDKFEVDIACTLFDNYMVNGNDQRKDNVVRLLYTKMTMGMADVIACALGLLVRYVRSERITILPTVVRDLCLRHLRAKLIEVKRCPYTAGPVSMHLANKQSHAQLQDDIAIVERVQVVVDLTYENHKIFDDECD